MKIRSKIFITFSVGMTLFLLIGVSIVYNFSSENLETEIHDHLETSVRLKVDHVETYVEGLEGRLFDFSSDGKVKDCTLSIQGLIEPVCSNEEFVNHLVEDKLPVTEGLKEIFILSQEGAVIATTDSYSTIGESFSGTKLFEEGLLRPSVGDIVIKENEQEFSFLVSAPIHELTGGDEVIGVIVGRFDTARLYEILTNRAGLHSTWESYLVNEDLYMLSPSRFLDDVVLTQRVDTENAELCFSEEFHGVQHTSLDLGEFLDYRGFEVIGAHRYIPATGWCLLVEVDSSDTTAPLSQLYLLVLIIVFGMILSAMAISFSIGSMISQPIQKLSRAMKKVEEGDLTTNIDLALDDEIGVLARSFMKMTESIQLARLDVDEKVMSHTSDISEQKQKLMDQQQAILNILEDVEEEKERAESLTIDLQKFKLAVENTSDLIMITDPQTRILHANPSLSGITGHNIKDTLGKRLQELWGDKVTQEKYDEMFTILKDKKERVKDEVTAIRKDGTEFEMAVNMSPILNADGKVEFFVVITRDITKEKKIDAMKTEFISLASHQLRTPLSSMRWFCEMLLDGDAGELNEEQLEFVGNINASNQRMITLVNALLNISRIESGRIIIDPEPTNLKELIEEVIKELKPKIETRHHQIIVSIHEKLGEVNIDPKLVGEVYKNLLTNAIKYTPDHGEINVFVSLKDDVIISQVSDTGYGIPQEDLNNVFKKFFRSANIVEFDTDGTGLGLYLTKAIVESSGGEIYVESEVDKGTSFFFTLPKEGMKKKEGAVKLS